MKPHTTDKPATQPTTVPGDDGSDELMGSTISPKGPYPAQRNDLIDEGAPAGELSGLPMIFGGRGLTADEVTCRVSDGS
jgi:hypothetical protein